MFRKNNNFLNVNLILGIFIISFITFITITIIASYVYKINNNNNNQDIHSLLPLMFLYYIAPFILMCVGSIFIFIYKTNISKKLLLILLWFLLQPIYYVLYFSKFNDWFKKDFDYAENKANMKTMIYSVLGFVFLIIWIIAIILNGISANGSTLQNVSYFLIFIPSLFLLLFYFLIIFYSFYTNNKTISIFNRIPILNTIVWVIILSKLKNNHLKTKLV